MTVRRYIAPPNMGRRRWRKLLVALDDIEVNSTPFKHGQGPRLHRPISVLRTRATTPNLVRMNFATTRSILLRVLFEVTPYCHTYHNVCHPGTVVWTVPDWIPVLKLNRHR